MALPPGSSRQSQCNHNSLKQEATESALAEEIEQWKQSQKERSDDAMLLAGKTAEGIRVKECGQPPEGGNGEKRILPWSFQEEGSSVITLVFSF